MTEAEQLRRQVKWLCGQLGKAEFCPKIMCSLGADEEPYGDTCIKCWLKASRGATCEDSCPSHGNTGGAE